ncbi:hypothetical protein HS048_02510 [Planomonospora sp. ID91781]|uniref:DUF6461 domain-containing protein n=1 Tax=Planomonospora sp. ID91781 TaxID=2738135 RepID=UPI0018C35520|nr:DUF6461 domain-containing protein [Planomonospora sp. ID91781]MBG0819625.1 hypothetical protein [Planomonospora sp. ID91781]
MSGATAATYEWLYREFTYGVDETWLYATFVQGLSPQEALRRIGVAPGPLEDSGFGVAAYAARGGTVLIECGWAGIIYDMAGRLSAGTSAAAVIATVKREDFAYCVDGRLVTTFDLYSYSLREGSDPDRLHAEVENLGLNDGDPLEFPDDPISRALALAERATGVHLSAARYGGPALIGSTDHLEPYR